MSGIRTTRIIFDLDGTLIDVSDRHYKVYSEMAKQFGGNLLAKDEYWDLKRANTPWQKILQLSDVSADKIQEFLELFIARIEQPDYLKLDKLFPGAIETLDEVSSYELYLLSLRRSEESLLDELKWLGVKNKFKKILSGHTDNVGFELKVDLIKSIRPGPADLVVGDTEADILMAKKLKLISVAVTSGIRSGAFLKDLEPDFLLESVKDLPQVIKKLPS